MELKEVTDEWVLDTFDIDEERKVKTEESKIYNCSLEDLFMDGGKISLPDFIKKLEVIVKEAKERIIATRTVPKDTVR